MSHIDITSGSEPHKGIKPQTTSDLCDPASSYTAHQRSGLTTDITSKPRRDIQYTPVRGYGDRDVGIVPIDTGNEAELARLALSISKSDTFATITRRISYQSQPPTNEQFRRDTLADIELGDPVLDPSSPEFNFYKWARMWVRLMDEEGIKIRRVGFTFKNLNVSGSGPEVNIQKDVVSIFMTPLRARGCFNIRHKPEKKILRDFNGMVKSGEMLMVVGRPGSGCSTFLKTICGEVTGLSVDKRSILHYDGIPADEMHKEFKGEAVYNQEVDKHFPHLTVGETLEFAAASRTPQQRIQNLSRHAFIKYTSQVAMAVFGLSHTKNTKVGNDFVRGVSGGERKRVSIAEMALGGCSIACWDNSTRGLDSATALEFVKALRVGSSVHSISHAVAIYQASQAIYDVFDKVIVLYEGREIYFGSTSLAKTYFETMGWHCPPRQTTADFLTGVTNPQERKPRDGFERRVPRTSEEFEAYWRSSNEFAALQKDIDQLEADVAVGSRAADEFKETRRARQAKHMWKKSPYTISIPMQVRVCTLRGYRRIWNDKTSTLTTIIGQIIMALIVGSIYFGTPNTTDGLFSKGAALYFAILLNALIAVSEINHMYEQRPIVEKQASYAFYHPFAEAFAGLLADFPVKFISAAAFNIILYFLAGLSPTASQFFIFFLFVFVSTMTMTVIFRSVAAATRTITQALAIAGVLVLAIVIYTGFAIPRPYMHPWFKWISWINPIAYSYEAILVNEVHGTDFPCENLIPSYPNLSGPTFVCSVAGAVPGETFVSGDAWAQATYEYSYSHIWRNLGILFAFLTFFFVVFLIVTELNSSARTSADVPVFRRTNTPKAGQVASREASIDCNASTPGKVDDNPTTAKYEKISSAIQQKDIFTWKDVVYDIKIKGETRRLLDHVSGWVTPGCLTALMGVSGAGKTTLLDVLAQRTSIGIVTGDMFVNGKPLDASFQRKSGYVQQQDLHLETTTIREALRFSAMLRQPKSVSKKEKYEFVEDVIRILNMEEFSEAVVGISGEGLSVEQRKFLTIGVELAAKPELLLFLDEPTSGLDSQSSWAIVTLLRKLANSGQAVLATIHQPSPILFQQFDRLLFLAKGGKTVYFGEIGSNSETLINYFESHGSRRCGDAENPAEFMLEAVGAGSSGKSTQDWHEIWKDSEEHKEMLRSLDQIYQERVGKTEVLGDTKQDLAEFAVSLWSQQVRVTIRIFQEYWRTPSYVWGKLLLGVTAALFIGFSFFQPENSLQGLQNTIFSIFMVTTIFSPMVQQIMPRFVIQRSLYEVRERPSKTYSWIAFIIANIIAEIPYQILLGILVFGAYYYPVFGIQSSERQGLILLFSIQFFIFASTFAHLVISALPDAETAGKIATFLFSLMLTFNGVLQPPQALPGFWIFMYRVSPMTYVVGGMAADGLHGLQVKCSDTELNVFDPPSGQTCGDYMTAYLSQAPGQLYNPMATSQCEYCPLSNADQYLASVAIFWSDRWRNFGIVWSYIVFNIFMASLLYYMFRVKRWSGVRRKKFVDTLFNMIGVVGYWARSLLVRNPEETPAGKEAINHQLF